MGVSPSSLMKKEKKNLSIFDFAGEDEPVETSFWKFFKNKRKSNQISKKNSCDYSRSDKSRFRQFFSQGTMEEEKNLNEPLHVDVDNDDKDVKDGVPASNAATQSSSSHYETETYSEPNFPDIRTILYGSDFNAVKVLDKVTVQNHIESTIPRFLSSKEPVRITLDDDNDIELTSQIPSTDLADSAGPSVEGLKQDFSECDIEPIVVVYPKHVIYDKKRYWKPQMTFSCNSIKLDVSAVYEVAEPFVLEWKTDDLVKIESKWCELLKTANVGLHIKSNDEKLADDAKSSGIVEIRFAVSDPNWFKQEEAIKLLDVRYIDKWDADLNFNAFSEDVVYPQGDPDSVSINMRDIELLQPERFINDNIVDFYTKYLKNKIKPEDSHRFYFFNTFFFRKLADFDNNNLRACRGSEAFQRVRTWTKKVDIFQKDYIFVPVNFSLHWSLIIICHPGEVANFSDETIEKSGKVPCILHMNSMKGSHGGLKNLIQSYLLEEWKERNTNPAEDVSSKFLNLQFVPLEVPQQQNSFDCGLFLLHYMELFVEQTPVNFPFKFSNASRFLKKDWFPPAAASLKRGHIKTLIFEIAKQNSRIAPSSACHDNYSFDTTDLKEQASEEFLQDAYNLNQTCRESSCHNTFQPIICTPVAAKPGRFDEGSPVDGNAQLFGQTGSRNQIINVISPIEEGGEARELTACSPKEEEECGLHLSLSTEPSMKNIKAKDAHWSPEILADSEEYKGGIHISRGDSEKYPISSEIQKNHILALCESRPENAEVIYECSSTSSGELEACIIEDSEEKNGLLDSVSLISHRQKRLFDPSNQKRKSSSEGIVSTNKLLAAASYVVKDSQEGIEELDASDTENYRPRGRLFDSSKERENFSKRQRLMTPGTERKVTGKLSKGIQEIVFL